MLKYEGKFKGGDTIRAYDFEPMKGRLDSYIEGVVTGTKAIPEMGGARVYTIAITKDMPTTTHRDRTGDEGYVPMEVAFGEYEGRVVKV